MLRPPSIAPKAACSRQRVRGIAPHISPLLQPSASYPWRLLGLRRQAVGADSSASTVSPAVLRRAITARNAPRLQGEWTWYGDAKRARALVMTFDLRRCPVRASSNRRQATARPRDRSRISPAPPCDGIPLPASGTPLRLSRSSSLSMHAASFGCLCCDAISFFPRYKDERAIRQSAQWLRPRIGDSEPRRLPYDPQTLRFAACGERRRR